jgi:hypothetical protein
MQRSVISFDPLACRSQERADRQWEYNGDADCDSVCPRNSFFRLGSGGSQKTALEISNVSQNFITMCVPRLQDDSIEEDFT